MKNTEKNQPGTNLNGTENAPRKIVNQFNFDPNKGKEEKFGPSVTVPEMTMSLKEILQRYTRGGQVATFAPVYHGEDDEFLDVERMDPIERIEYARQLKTHIEEAKANLQRIWQETSEAQTEDNVGNVAENTNETQQPGQ